MLPAMAASISSRWVLRLRTRRRLLARAERSVRYWARRAGSAHGREMLGEAVARRALRRRQVAEAERIVGVHVVSNRGVAMIAGFEGFRSRPYRDVGGVWTIGYGETRGVGPRTPPITRAAALRRLRHRVDHDFLAPVLRTARAIHLTLAQQEADALASLVYNLGPGILDHDRTLGAALRSGNRRRMADAFLVYDRAGGHRMPGLTRRRRTERALFLS
jgi:lysozyme